MGSVGEDAQASLGNGYGNGDGYGNGYGDGDGLEVAS